MPPGVKRRAKGSAKAPPNRWTLAEINVLLECLSSEEFLAKHSKTLKARQFPPFTLRDACVKENEYHGVCVAIAQEILNQQGEHNNFNLRPFASIASKILDISAKARASNAGLEGQELFDAFDVEAFMTASAPPGPEAAGAEQEAAGTSGAKPSDAAAADAAKAAEAAPPPVEEEYDDTYVAPVRDPSNITFQTRILNPHLVCTLCMGYFNDACTIIECLHTFCRACIMRHFKESQQVCPTCDSNLGTNPRDLVRTDRTLQSIVDKVFPQFAAQTTAAAKRPASPAMAAGGGGGRAPKASRPSPAVVQQPPPEEVAAEEISFSLQEVGVKPSSAGVRLEKPYLRTSARLTVAHLKKYLAKKMGPDSGVGPTAIQIMCRDEPLPLEISLDQITRTRWRDSSEDLVLTYRILDADDGAGGASTGGAGGGGGGAGGGGGGGGGGANAPPTPAGSSSAAAAAPGASAADEKPGDAPADESAPGAAGGDEAAAAADGASEGGAPATEGGAPAS